MGVSTTNQYGMYDVCIVGAGPQGLAILSALRAKHKQLGSGCQDPHVCVVDPSGTWMHNWDANFRALNISYLRSPAWAHPDACCQEAMVNFARCQGRTRELKCCSFHGSTLDSMSKLEGEYYTNPSTELFNDFCTNLTSTLPHDLIRGSVVDIIKQGQGTHRNKFEVDVYTHETGLSSKIIAAQVVLALGASPCANIPAPFELVHNQFDLAANRCGRVIHSSDAKRLEVMQSDLRADDTLLVIGGGLSAAQAALLGAERGVASTILCSRRPLVTRHYDLPLEWMDDRFGRNQKRNRDRVAQYFSLPFSDRIKAIKRIRDGGSVPPDYMRALDSHAGAGRLEIKVDSVCAVEAANESVRVRFSSGMTITASYVVLATGFAMAVPKIPLVDTLASRLALPVCEGFPVLTDDCTWQPTDIIQAPAKDGNIIVVGALAAGALGPCAFNLLGARKAGAMFATRYFQGGSFHRKKKWIADEFSLV